MNPIIVTSLNNEILKAYGHKMIDGIIKFWPKNFDIHVYCEDDCLETSGRLKAFDLYACQPDLKEFIERNADKNGGAQYSYKFDACKFAHKSYAIIDALSRANGGRVYWIDADVQTMQPVDGSWAWDLVRGYYSSFLGRKGFHTETGFLAFDTNYEFNERFWRAWKAYYDTDKIFDLKEWHDCEVYDTIRKNHFGMFKNLTPSADGVEHVFNKFFLPVMSHHKGPTRKNAWVNGKEKHI